MAEFTLVIGNKNYSSWSFRAWIAMRHFGFDFDEVLVRLNFEGSEDGLSTNKELFEHSPAGRVPVLKHGGLTVWESLAILEYLNEVRPGAGMWPEEPAARAKARIAANEMHAGFAALRSEMPMNIRRAPAAIQVSVEAKRDVARIQDIWRDCLSESGGPFLFGSFSIADAFYAPVVNRFHIYDVPADEAVRSYMDAVTALPAYEEWRAAAQAEPWIIEQEER